MPHRVLLRIALLCLLLAGCDPTPAWTDTPSGPRLPTPTRVPLNRTPGAATQPAGDALAVFFSDPLVGDFMPGPDAQLIAAVNAARQSVDVAIYNLSIPGLVDALIAADERGVAVRMVMDSDVLENDVPQRLTIAGIPIRGDRREGLMHNKFMVIDRQEVYTGSMNFTNASSYRDYNNLVRLRSSRAAQNYTVEFEEMFLEDLFGPDDRAATPYPQVTINGIPVEIYFSPDDGVADQIIAEIEAAASAIDFMAYAFTSDDIADALRAANARGVTVRGVFDDSQVASNTGGEYENLRRAGLQVRKDGIEGLMHHKVFIIDTTTVITGSYNFSASAENRNDENVLIIHDQAFAAQFQQNFEGVYAGAQR